MGVIAIVEVLLKLIGGAYSILVEIARFIKVITEIKEIATEIDKELFRKSKHLIISKKYKRSANVHHSFFSNYISGPNDYW